MPKYRTTPPASSGRFRGVLEIPNTTDWTDIKSSDFYDPCTGQPLPSGLTIIDIQVVVQSPFGNPCFLKYRARGGANDPISASDGVIPVYYGIADTPVNLLTFSGDTFSIKKADTNDYVVVFAGLDN